MLGWRVKSDCFSVYFHKKVKRGEIGQDISASSTVSFPADNRVDFGFFFGLVCMI